MVLKLVGAPLSSCTRRVAAILKEKKVPFEVVAVDFSKGEHKSPAHLKNQPFGKVPYIVEDDGFQLFESRAICKYIALKYQNQGTSLIPDPADFKATGLFEQAVSIETANFDSLASTIAVEKVFKPHRGLATDEKLAQEKLAELERNLDVYNTILGGQKYLAGENLTIADLFHLPYGALLLDIGLDIFSETKRPNVARWWKDISSRESWQTVKDRADA